MITEVLINDTMSGTIISPAPDQFITRLEMTRSQVPAWQQEHYLGYPFNLWTAGRFVLKDARGVLFNFATQPGGIFIGATVLLNSGSGVSIAYQGDLFLECALRGQEWRMDISDVPVTRSQAA
jgi:hypothetical protein